ncbi:MAG: aminodeoxychorismate lyase [Verrucomicrobia bacterium]|nr:aminodeoxychorismate lyase [Verrucomicrobiota bacterium]
MRKKRKENIRYFLLLFLTLLSATAYISYNYYVKIFHAVVDFVEEERTFYVYSGWSFEDLSTALFVEGIIQNQESFQWVAEKKQFSTPKAGKYTITKGLSNNELINLFRSGHQETIQLTFNTIRTAEELASRVGKQLECDSLELIRLMQSPEYANKYGFNPATFFCMFIPNTYDFYWSTSAEEFIARMAVEYKKYWTEDRKEKARSIGLSQSEVSILASIVQAEQMIRVDERPMVAGLYINRLKRGMRLQSDPTLVYALGDFSINRVLNKHKVIESPYNTYKYAGLPPGPINLPELSSLEAVLNYKRHDYIYMCAKADFSSYHHFSKSLRQHNIYARQYQNELNRRRIMQ